mmetsp:Transcript_164695/g.528365  ORF Transcript_164695/g.528365 Transcript_164695/m.528365 type:complete len:273 (-) Transcript_164695:57-875(-)
MQSKHHDARFGSAPKHRVRLPGAGGAIGEDRGVEPLDHPWNEQLRGPFIDLASARVLVESLIEPIASLLGLVDPKVIISSCGLRVLQDDGIVVRDLDDGPQALLDLLGVQWSTAHCHLDVVPSAGVVWPRCGVCRGRRLIRRRLCVVCPRDGLPPARHVVAREGPDLRLPIEAHRSGTILRRMPQQRQPRGPWRRHARGRRWRAAHMATAASRSAYLSRKRRRPVHSAVATPAVAAQPRRCQWQCQWPQWQQPHRLACRPAAEGIPAPQPRC